MHILCEFAKSINGNPPETSLYRTYGQAVSEQLFIDAITQLEQEGVIERIPPFHVRLK